MIWSESVYIEVNWIPILMICNVIIEFNKLYDFLNTGVHVLISKLILRHKYHFQVINIAICDYFVSHNQQPY